MADWIIGDNTLDPLADAARLKEQGIGKNFAKVGSARPSSLLYTYGPGAILDLPHFTVMPSGFGAWDRIWDRREGKVSIHAPRLLSSVRVQLGYQVKELRPFPYQAPTTLFSNDGSDLGVPAMVFPQWLRCTKCNTLEPLMNFSYINTHPHRPDEARFEHGCTQKRGSKRGALALPARYLLACANGHLDEFPYELWVHEGLPCSSGAEIPRLKMLETTASRGASAIIKCTSCGAGRGMNEAQGVAGRAKLPRCRGRHPHLDSYESGGCGLETNLMLIGASNLWFPVLQSVIVMPLDSAERGEVLADKLRAALGEELADYRDHANFLRKRLKGSGIDTSELTDTQLLETLELALKPQDDRELEDQRATWSPVDLLVPEWNYLKTDAAGEHHEDLESGLTVSNRQRGADLPEQITRVLTVERLRKANALIGFTRIDEMDRVLDLPSRLVPLSTNAPEWVVATEDRGEGVFLELDETAVAQWEARVEQSRLWEAHREAHDRNFWNRMSDTATRVRPEERLLPPRYWLVHTLAHVMLREMAMSSGYGAASLSERIYAWQGTPDRNPAAGLLILTSSSDSDGTLGGLVQLSEPNRLAQAVNNSLRRATRCSSDPVCWQRTPRDPEDFLHGAACHCCTMASETSCERANRFLDRRFLVSLPGEYKELGFFDPPR